MGHGSVGGLKDWRRESYWERESVTGIIWLRTKLSNYPPGIEFVARGPVIVGQSIRKARNYFRLSVEG